MGGLSRIQWRKSSRSASGEQCVEIGYTQDQIFTRDSKDLTGPILAFSHSEWTAFLGAVRNSKIDLG
jgi:Domain of unknown function (DUF397)